MTGEQSKTRRLRAAWVAQAAALLGLGWGASQAVHADPVRDASDHFWADLRALVVKCAVQPYHFDQRGKRVYRKLQSTCSEIQPLGTQAAVSLNGLTFRAEIEESPYSDGGDLDELRLFDRTGRLFAWRSAVPAFGDVMIALAGGEAEFRQVYLPPR